MVVALRREHPYDVFWMHGKPEDITRDTLFKGTALSAPVSNLLIHAALTAVVARRPSRRGEQALGGLGALLIAGYLGERLVRQRLRPSGWDGWSRRCWLPQSDWRRPWRCSGCGHRVRQRPSRGLQRASSRSWVVSVMAVPYGLGW
jgi:hypothetical protein